MKHCSLYETQKIFRILMNSMASPGEIFSMDGIKSDLPLVFRICDTLLDQEVSFTVTGCGIDTAFINNISFFTNAKQAVISQASFVIIFGGSSCNEITNVNQGTLEYPEKGATVIYIVDDLTAPGGITLHLSGPGIKVPFSININGVARKEFELLQQINSGYPLGIDTIFCDERQVISLPRTTSMVIQ